MEKLIIWKFEKHKDCWFIIIKNKNPNEKDYYVKRNNFWKAIDWDQVEARVIKTLPWVNPEAKITRVIKKDKDTPKREVIEWIYSSWNGNFWFIDVVWLEKWIFVHKKKSFNAIPWDIVRAEVKNYNWKKEAIIFEILESQKEIVTWVFKDHESFWFVIPDKEFESKDIFIPWNDINDADDWDKVEVRIVKKWPKNPQWIITKILEENLWSTDFEIIDFDEDDKF